MSTPNHISPTVRQDRDPERKVIAALIHSPLYFTLAKPERVELIKRLRGAWTNRQG